MLQLPMHDPPATAQIRHRHNLNHQTGPSGEMLRSLSSARFRVILLPREARPFPFLEHVLHEIFAEGAVDRGGLRFVGTVLDCNVLDVIISNIILLRSLGSRYCHLHRGFSRRGN